MGEARSRRMRTMLLFPSFGLFSMLLVSVVWIASVTHQNSNLSPSSKFLYLAVEHHVILMVVLVLTAVLYGFVLAYFSYRAIRKESSTTASMLEVILLFLSQEEQTILNHLVQNKGEATQADISRLPSMHRVKAHRLLQKMQNNNLIDVTAHGKVRHVLLKQHIKDALGF